MTSSKITIVKDDEFVMMSSKIKKEIEYSDGNRFISIKPSTLSLDIDFELNYNNPIIGTQRNKVKVFEDDLTDIYNSRTFCF